MTKQMIIVVIGALRVKVLTTTAADGIFTIFCVITKTLLFTYIENFTTKKENFQIKNSNIFHISAQNIDCGFTSTHNLCFEQKYEYPQSMF